ncbi:hypothetical protein IB286_02830 [Spongiibacter sp. KMU-158]|uniref:Uncharacterized protein n=1 Tax=Spongiibacter pelagi TaxID=2760804 RepID=A0A927GVI9_9GAMM|nr:hypothetical protein [Spongiibacter pelagi]MBD2857927.1 hypothetical protein [Spongiibacter pelagi]
MADILDPQLAALVDKTAVVGLSYFEVDGQLLQQRLLGGTVVRVTAEQGITLRDADDEEFTIPSSLAPWFVAPKGDYPAGNNKTLSNPDYLVTWDIHRCQDTNKPEGEHQWWEWVANTTPPTVGN